MCAAVLSAGVAGGVTACSDRVVFMAQPPRERASADDPARFLPAESTLLYADGAISGDAKRMVDDAPGFARLVAGFARDAAGRPEAQATTARYAAELNRHLHPGARLDAFACGRVLCAGRVHASDAAAYAAWVDGFTRNRRVPYAMFIHNGGAPRRPSGGASGPAGIEGRFVFAVAGGTTTLRL
jgi:hypothetical protein